VLTTTHSAPALPAGAAAQDLSAASAQATAETAGITPAGRPPRTHRSHPSHRCPYSGQRWRPGVSRVFYLAHDHDEQPHPCDRGDDDARCSLYVSNVRLLRAPTPPLSLAPRSEAAVPRPRTTYATRVRTDAGSEPAPRTRPPVHIATARTVPRSERMPRARPHPRRALDSDGIPCDHHFRPHQGLPLTRS
jgi:hypothetical protein